MGALRIRRDDVGSPKDDSCAQSNGHPNELTEVLTGPTGPSLSAADQAVAEQRFLIIEPLLSPPPEGMKKGAILEAICRQHGVKRSTVYGWFNAFNAGGLPALANKDRVDKGKPRSFNKAGLEFLVAAMLPCRGTYGSLSMREAFRAYEEESQWRAKNIGKRLPDPTARKYLWYLDEDGRLSPDAGLPEVSYATFRRWADRMPSPIKVMARGGKEAFANTQDILSFRNLSALLPLDYVVMDHRQLDLFCLVKQRDTWKLVRPWLTAAIDMRTRKWLAWDIVESPSSDSIASVLKRLFLKYGLPGALYWDNGKDFRCEWFEGRARQGGSPFRIADLETGIRGVLETLGVRVHHAIVRRARSKIIEPNFVNTANFDRSLPTWCGHKPTERPERFSELVDQHERWVKGERPNTPFETIEKVAWLYGEFLEKDLNERNHTGEGMRKVTPTGLGWMCPNECWEKLIGQVPRRSAPPEVIQFCFRKRRETTLRNGEVRVTFVSREYHYRIVDAPTGLMRLNGHKVEMAYDPLDLGTVAVYHDGQFVGLAENLELRKMGEQVFVEDERARRSARREASQLINHVHRNIPVASAEERALRRMAVVPDRQEPHRIGVQIAVSSSVAVAVEAIQRNGEAPEYMDRQLEVVSPVVEADDAEFNFFD